MLGTQWFLMEMDENCRGMYENCREIDLIQCNHPPQRYIKRERKCTKQSIGLFFNEWKCDYKQVFYRTIKLFYWPTLPYPNGSIILHML